jgi:hypothetical protein
VRRRTRRRATAHRRRGKERPIFGGLSEQAQSRQRNEEAVLACSRRQAERSAKGSGLRLRKILGEADDGADDLVECGEREMRL